MSYPGKVLNGVVVFDHGPSLPDGTPVRVEAVGQVQQSIGAPSWEEEILKIAGTATGLPSDLADNHDHYLYGTPKK